MNRLKKDLCLLKCFFGNHVGLVGMIFFHVVVSACFLICFFSVGINLYEQVIKLKEDVGESNGYVFCINDAKNEKQIINFLNGNGEMGYCLLGEMEETKENSFTIGMYEDHNLFASDGEVFFLYRFGELTDGVVIWSDVCTENGMDPEDLQGESVELTIGGKTKQYRIAAVLDSDADSAFQNFEKEIYIPRQLLDEGEHWTANYILMKEMAYKSIEEKLETLDFYVIESNSNLQTITDTVKLVKIIICFFGIFFGIAVSIQVIDLIGLLIEKNRGKFFMLSALGYYEKDIKKAIYKFCIIMAFTGTLFGFFICAVLSRGMLGLYQDRTFFGVDFSELLCVKPYIAVHCFVVLCICVVIYAVFSLKELNGENIVIGLNEMES